MRPATLAIMLLLFCCCCFTSPLALVAEAAVTLEAGEVVTDELATLEQSQAQALVAAAAVEGPPLAKAVQCDAAQSRAARNIVQEVSARTRTRQQRAAMRRITPNSR